MASPYWTISTETVYAFGRGSSSGSANLKKTNRNIASFNGDAQSNAFGYNVCLTNSNATQVSDRVGLYVNKTAHAAGNSGTANHYYWADVRSQGYEPNQSRVKLHFSADKK